MPRLALIYIFLALPALAGEAGAQRAPSPTGQDDGARKALALLLTAPRVNPVRECAIMALRDNTGLMNYRMGRAADDVVRAGLTASDDPHDPDLATLRESQMKTWSATHSPGQVAYQEFRYCSQAQRVRPTLGSLEQTCFNVVAVPAMTEVLKHVHEDKAKARQEVQHAFGDALPKDFLAKVVSDVYASDPEADDYAVHRQVLASCIIRIRQ